MSIYIDFHVLQTVPPSCVNRDDTGSPKTAVYGGAVRARVSSQAWKHAMREYFEKYYDDNEVGIRTKNILELISAEIKEIDSSIDDKKALALAEKFARTMANKKNGKDVPILKLEQDKYTKEYRLTTLVFLSKAFLYSSLVASFIAACAIALTCALKQIRKLFPAHAGVIPSLIRSVPSWDAFPRTRGGDPVRAPLFHKLGHFSPHTRG